MDDELGGGMDASLVRTLNHRAALEEALGTEPFFYLNQVHGVQIAYPEDYEVESYAPGAPQERTVERARAVLENSRSPMRRLVVRACPWRLWLLIAFPWSWWASGSRTGSRSWRWLTRSAAALDGVLQQTVQRMRQLGAEKITAWLASICGSCYEVPEAMRTESTELIPQVHSVTSQQTPTGSARRRSRRAGGGGRAGEHGLCAVHV